MRVVALSGGVGGARLVQGLADELPAGSLTVVANTGDDFDHWGLRICPDLDTLLYTLAGLAPVERGWGLEDETFSALEMVRRFGGEGWFALGDRDLGTHLFRTAELAAGRRLTEVTRRLIQGLGISGVDLLPMADEPKPTWVDTASEGVLSFQQWLVGRRAEPLVRAIRFGADPPATPEVLEALEAADLVVIPPSNPYVSVDPILTLPGVRERVVATVTVAVSPIVGGAAVKGPLAEMIHELAGRPASAAAVADHYRGLVDGFVAAVGDPVPGRVRHAAVIMGDRTDRARLAREVLAFAEEFA